MTFHVRKRYKIIEIVGVVEKILSFGLVCEIFSHNIIIIQLGLHLTKK